MAFVRHEVGAAFEQLDRSEQRALKRGGGTRNGHFTGTRRVVGRLLDPPRAEALMKASRGAHFSSSALECSAEFEGSLRGSANPRSEHAGCPVLIVPVMSSHCRGPLALLAARPIREHGGMARHHSIGSGPVPGNELAVDS